MSSLQFLLGFILLMLDDSGLGFNLCFLSFCFFDSQFCLALSFKCYLVLMLALTLLFIRKLFIRDATFKSVLVTNLIMIISMKLVKIF